MNITNEIKSKLFAQYIGQYFLCIKDIDEGDTEIKKNDKLKLTCINMGGIQLNCESDSENWNIGLESDTKENNTGEYFCDFCDTKHFKLILKPLTELTKEEAFELAKIMFPFTTNGTVDELITITLHTITFTELAFIDGTAISIDKEDAFISWEFGEDFENNPNTIQAFQYLQDLGYDLPQYLLQGKTLKQAGLAIYEK